VRNNAKFLSDPCNFALFLTVPDIYEVLSLCPGALTPKVTPGGSCDSTGECAQGYCNKPGGLCPGTCTAYAQAGQSCANGAQCDPKLQCKQGTCAPYGKVGDPCQTANDCPLNVICLADATCQPSTFFCDPVTSTCKAGVGEGAMCGAAPNASPTAGQILCAAGLWCNQVAFTAQGTCQQEGGVGAPCNFSGGCNQGLHCVGDVSFNPGAKLGTCASSASQGGACTTAADCQKGLQCANGACAPPSDKGGPCGMMSDCKAGLTCSGGTCVTAGYPGDPCGVGTVCVLSRCASGKCVDHAKVGQACTANTDCTTNACVHGTCADTSVCAAQ
jgi:hypothetical protein